MKCLAPLTARSLSSFKHQNGVALIAVMLVVAFVVVIAVSMSERLQMHLQRQITLQERQQALWLALGAEEFVKRTLRTSVLGKESVNLSQAWAQEAAFPVEQATIRGKITDLQACFNVNALQKKTINASNNNTSNNNAANSNGAGTNDPNNPEGNRTGALAQHNQYARENGQLDPQSDEQVQGQSQGQTTPNPAAEALQRLLEQKAAELSIPAEYFTARLTDWLDENNELTNANGAEESDYAGLTRPYYTANSLMVSPSELRTLLDITAADYELIAPWLCVIPQNNQLKININTLSSDQAGLLSGLIPNLSLEDAETVLGARPEKGYTDINEFWQHSVFASISMTNEIKSMFDVRSDYFQAQLQVDTLESSFTLNTVFKMNDQRIEVVSRRFGGPR